MDYLAHACLYETDRVSYECLDVIRSWWRYRRLPEADIEEQAEQWLAAIARIGGSETPEIFAGSAESARRDRSQTADAVAVFGKVAELSRKRWPERRLERRPIRRPSPRTSGHIEKPATRSRESRPRRRARSPASSREGPLPKPELALAEPGSAGSVGVVAAS